MAVGIPNFPTSLDAASDLVEATNNASTTINMVGGLSNSATTITVVSTAAFPSTGIIRIDDELISYSAKTSTTFTVQTRGFESTTAASHIDGATVSLDITAASNNAKNTAIIALETKVGTGSSTPTANTVLRGTGTGTTAFGQVGLTTDVTGTLPAANGGTGITSLGANVATFLGTPSSANLASAVTDETGSGALVFGTSPTFTTSIIDPLVIGGTGTTSTLTLRSTSGVGTTGADIVFQTGNNGAKEAMRIVNSGLVGIGTSSPGATLDVIGATRTTTFFILPADSGHEWWIGSFSTSGVWQIVRRKISDGTWLNPVTVSPGAPTDSWYIDTSGRVGIGTPSPATSAKLEISGTNGALLVPRLTTTERNALTAVNGMIIYNTTTNTMQGRINGAWTDM